MTTRRRWGATRPTLAAGGLYYPIARGLDPRAFMFRNDVGEDMPGERHTNDGGVWVACVVLGRLSVGPVDRPRASRIWFVVRRGDEGQFFCHADKLAASCGGGVPFDGSHKKVTTSWWRSAGGALERVATVYELARQAVGDAPPREGWELVGSDEAAALVAHYKALPSSAGPGMSETEQAERLRVADLARRRREARAEHAATMLLMHERALKREARLVTKWRAKKARAEAALVRKEGRRT